MKKDCIIALDIGGTLLKSCLFDTRGALIPDSFDREPVDSNGDLSSVKCVYQTLTKRLKKHAEDCGYIVTAVAANIPGPFDFKNGVSRMKHKYLAIYNVPLCPWFQEILGDVPVRFLHDSSAFLFGAAKQHPDIRNCAGVMIGTGLGFCVMENGDVLQNEAGGPKYSIFALPYRGTTVEEFVSARGVVHHYNDRAATPADSALEVSERAEKGDRIACEVFSEMGAILAETILPILRDTGSTALYLGGQISKSFRLFEKSLKQGLASLDTLTLIEPAEDVDMAHLVGVANWYLHTQTASPMKLEAVCKDIIWGGTKLSEEYNKPSGKIAEAWELSVHPEGDCKIISSEHSGKLLSDYLGSKDDFPVMIKLIDACDKLSIQVHPAKTEMWYIVDCEPGAKLVYGLKKPFDKAEFAAAIENHTVEELLNFVPVHPGDVFFIPQGLVHAIGAGILIAEIQQNSNVTYRVYDYDRLQNGKKRELHVEAALNSIKDFTEADIQAVRYSRGKGEASTLADCAYFKVDLLDIRGEKTLKNNSAFTSVICLKGSGELDGQPIIKGDSFFLPKDCPSANIKGDLQIVVTTP